MLDDQHCANCGRVIDVPGQKHCPDCGLPTPAHRIDWHFLGHELEHSVLHMDRGVLFTLKNLMLRPGHMIRGYIEGRREGIVKPFLLLMMVAAALMLMGKYLLAGDLLGSVFTIDPGESPPETINGKFDVAYLVSTFTGVRNWLNQHYTLVNLLLVPVHALALRLMFARVGKINYPEWLVITTFLTAQSFVLMTLLMPLQLWHPVAQQVITLIAMLYAVATLMQYFRGEYARWKIAVRTLLSYLLYTLITMALLIIASAIIVLMAMR